MKAVVCTKYGETADVVELRQIPEPNAGPNEVLIEVHAASVNPVDFKIQQGALKAIRKLDFPFVMGFDVSGVVVAVGAGVQQFKVGDEVFSRVGAAYMGTFAEFVSLPARNVFAIPEGLSFGEAAALGVNHITAWGMLHGKARIQPWETVLIFGIGGGVSLAALQLARLAGARVLVTSRDPAKLERALSLGADAAIDGRGDVVRQVMAATDGHGADVVIENVGAAV